MSKLSEDEMIRRIDKALDAMLAAIAVSFIVLLGLAWRLMA